MPHRNRDTGQISMQKVVDLGIIDSWLRGVAVLAPPGADPRDDVMQEFNLHTAPVMKRRPDELPDLNRHTLSHDSAASISHGEIRAMPGFRRLLQACSRNDVRIDVTDLGGGRLEALFQPDEPFLQSRIFGGCHIAALPEFFRDRK
jgi:hypothetical protein